MMNTSAELLTKIQTPAPVGLTNRPSIGDQHAHMACASLGFNSRVSPTPASRVIQHAVLPSVDLSGRTHLQAASQGELGAWAEADERCPYCKSKGYALHAHQLGNLTMLEGTCRFCGTHALSLLD